MRSTVRRYRSWDRAGLPPLALAVALLVAACGGNVPSSQPQASTSEPASSVVASSAPSAIASATPKASPSSAPSASAAQGSPYPSFPAFTACSLLTADVVTTLLGKAPGPATGFEGGPSQQLCTWLTDSASGKANELDLGVFIKSTTTDQGFAALPAAQSPEPVAGVGDVAEYAAVGGATGPGSQVIQASKGQVEISMTIHYGGTLQAPGSTKAALIAAAQAALAALGVAN